MKAKDLEIQVHINDEQIQEIDRHICIIEKTIKMLEPTGTNPLVRETVFGATAKISDILAGEPVLTKEDMALRSARTDNMEGIQNAFPDVPLPKDTNKDEKKPVRYFFNLITLKTHASLPNPCIEEEWLEVTEENLPYLKKPAGEWEFRKYEDGETVLGYKSDGHGDPMIAACPPFVDDSNVVLSRYRWCKPRKPVEIKAIDTDSLEIVSLPTDETIDVLRYITSDDPDFAVWIVRLKKLVASMEALASK